MVGVEHQGSHNRPTLHGGGRSKVAGGVAKAICRRILPLGSLDPGGGLP